MAHFSDVVMPQSGMTALMLASKEGRATVVTLLMDAGVNTSVQDRVCARRLGGARD